MNSIRKTFIAIITLLFILGLCFSFINEVYAATGLEQGEPKVFEGNDNPPGAESVGKIRDVVVTITRIISATIALVTILVLGMKYMTSAPGDRADLKKSSVQYVVGAIIVFGSSQLLSLLLLHISYLEN